MKGLDQLKAKAKAKSRRQHSQSHQPSPTSASLAQKKAGGGKPEPPRWLHGQELSDEEMQAWAKKALEQDGPYEEEDLPKEEFPTNISLENWLRSELDGLNDQRDSSPEPPPPPPPEEEHMEGAQDTNELSGISKAPHISTIAQMVRRFREQEPLPSTERKARLDKENINFHWLPKSLNQQHTPKYSKTDESTFPVPEKIEMPKPHDDSTKTPNQNIASLDSLHQSQLSLQSDNRFHLQRRELSEEDLDRRASLLLERCEQVLDTSDSDEMQISVSNPSMDQQDFADLYQTYRQQHVLEVADQQHDLATSIPNISNTVDVSLETAQEAILRLRKRFGQSVANLPEASQGPASELYGLDKQSTSANLPETTSSQVHDLLESLKSPSLESTANSPPPSYCPLFRRENTPSTQSLAKHESPSQKTHGPPSTNEPFLNNQTSSENEANLRLSASFQSSQSSQETTAQSPPPEYSPNLKPGEIPVTPTFVSDAPLSTDLAVVNEAEITSRPTEHIPGKTFKELNSPSLALEESLHQNRNEDPSDQIWSAPESPLDLEDKAMIHANESKHSFLDDQLSPLENSLELEKSDEVLEVSDLTDPIEWSLSGSAFDNNSSNNLPPPPPQRKLFNSSESMDQLFSPSRARRRLLNEHNTKKTVTSGPSTSRKHKWSSRERLSKWRQNSHTFSEDTAVIWGLAAQIIHQYLFPTRSTHLEPDMKSLGDNSEQRSPPLVTSGFDPSRKMPTVQKNAHKKCNHEDELGFDSSKTVCLKECSDDNEICSAKNDSHPSISIFDRTTINYQNPFIEQDPVVKNLRRRIEVLEKAIEFKSKIL